LWLFINPNLCHGWDILTRRSGIFVFLDRDQQTGLLVPPRDTFTLAEAMRYLVAHKEKRKSMGRTAKEWGKGKSSDRTLVHPV
jgi:glycosyltransferase involved in cell wall biosynthesis